MQSVQISDDLAFLLTLMMRDCITPNHEDLEAKRGGHRSHKLLVAMAPFTNVTSGANSYPKLLPQSANHKKAGFRVTGDQVYLAPSHPPLRICFTNLQLPPFMGGRGGCAKH
uniref:Uncharacterized protein n=1 Tax=Candidatus Kentrum sp. SD TaxID=2126332 RepID=A0A451BN13_9GAMM|nr:MAG: hypothetical protein BECKSD772D_GA0070982_105819 [Candidatus Kentron sp. SD]